MYCLEWCYEDACDYQEGLETDEFDSVASHFSARENKTGNLVGTIRIIHPSEKGLPALNHFEVDKKLIPNVPARQVGEISRLAVSKEYRRRAIDKAIYTDNVINFSDVKERRNWRRRFEAELVSGLYHCIYAESIERGLTHLYAVMSAGLHSILTSWGLSFTPIGPAIDYHGMRRPYIATVEDNLLWFQEESLRMV